MYTNAVISAGNKVVLIIGGNKLILFPEEISLQERDNNFICRGNTKFVTYGVPYGRRCVCVCVCVVCVCVRPPGY